MSLNEQKTIFSFFSNSWTEVRQTYFDLSKLSNEIGDKTNPKASWFFGSQFFDMIEEGENNPNFPLLDLDKSVLSLVDIVLVKKIISDVTELKMMLENSQISNVTNKENVWKEKLVGIGINLELAEKWSADIGGKGAEEQARLNILLDNLVEEEEELYYLLSNIGEVIGVSGAPEKFYTLAEVVGILKMENEVYSQAQFLASLREFSKDENRKELNDVILERLNTKLYFSHDFFNWDEALIFTFLLHIIYSRYEYLGWGPQIFLLQYYLIRAIAVGIPVYPAVGRALYETHDIVEYVMTCRDFSDAVSLSKENVVVNIENFETKTIQSLTDRYLGLAGDKWLDGFNLNEFIKNIYEGQKGRDIYTKWLQETFNVFIHLKNADIVESNKGGEFSEREEYHNDLLKLVASFGIGKDGSDFIVSYFKKDNPRVPLWSFLRYLEGVVPASDEVSLENIMELNEILKINNLLKEDEDLVLFHEDDGKFHWNLEMFE